MMTGFGYYLAKGIIILEFSLVVIFIFLTFILKFYYTWKNKRIQAKIIKIESYLQKASPEQPLIFPKSWKKLEFIMPIISNLDQICKDASWKSVRKNLLEEIVLPLARKATKRSQRHWIQRYYAAEAFSLATHKEDEKYIINLIEDEIPLVYLNALPAAISCGSQSVIDPLISQIASQRRLTQGTYLQAFVNAPADIVSIVVGHLNHTTDPYIRTTCYKLLMMHLQIVNVTWDINADLSSPNLELRIAAAKYLTKCKHNDAIPTLIKLLGDPQWEMRVAALNGLGSLNAQSEIPKIAALLRDSEWWVRMNAGQVLLTMGDAGLDILKGQDPNADKYAYDVAQYLLVIK